MTQWTKERTEELVKRWTDGQSAMFIAKTLGTSYGAVVRKLNRLNVVRRPSGHIRPITLPKVSI